MKGKLLQIRNVPPEFHRKLKMRAAEEGMSMSEYVLREVGHSLAVPTRKEILARIAAHPIGDVYPPPADVIRAERDSR